MNYLDEFRKAIADAGLNAPDEIHADGLLHRFSASGRRTDTAGWYVLHLDGLPAGIFGCWRSGVKDTWCSKSDGEMTEAERLELRQRIQMAKAAREKETAQRHGQAQREATRLWGNGSAMDSSEKCTAYQGYVSNKGVRPFGLRSAPNGVAMVPLCDVAGTLHSLQFINAMGSKKFLPDGRIKGCFHAMGDRDAMGIYSPIVIAEGFATAASIHMATGLYVAAAMNAGNLEAVATALHCSYPDYPVLIAADDDWNTSSNPGMAAAQRAALAVGGSVVAPRFQAPRAHNSTDFNDLHRLTGLAAVHGCFAEATEALQWI